MILDFVAKHFPEVKEISHRQFCLLGSILQGGFQTSFEKARVSFSKELPVICVISRITVTAQILDDESAARETCTDSIHHSTDIDRGRV
jgi:hypothetical protein